jgi:hypothetical protein
MLKARIEQAEKANRLRSTALKFQYTQTIQRQREERETLKQSHELRWNTETKLRSHCYRKGWAVSGTGSPVACGDQTAERAQGCLPSIVIVVRWTR